MWRSASVPQGAGDADRFRKYAAELVALAPDVLLATSGIDGALSWKLLARCRLCSSGPAEETLPTAEPSTTNPVR
jgi:hypothetical protein